MSATAAAPPGNGGMTTTEKNFSGRGLVIAASVLSAVLSSGLALGVQHIASKWQQERTERVAEVSKFVEAAHEFDTLVTKFMDKFLINADATAERDALRQNLQSQYNLLEIAKTNLDGLRVARASAYQDSLAVVGEELDKGLSAPQARGLMQSIADTRAAQVCVVFDLRRRADLPVVKTDERPCLGGYMK